MSTLGSDRKSKNDKDSLSVNDNPPGYAATSQKNDDYKKLRFNSDKSEIGAFSRRADQSVDSSSVLNNRSLREGDSN